MARLLRFLSICIILSFSLDAAAQDEQSLALIVNADQGEHTISRHIYGHFAEHLGRDIYDGFWTKEGTGEWHYNEAVIEALRKIEIPNLRWPGGCFADYYHWRDGIGPREDRPTIVNTLWGGVTEDNSFGTHEFMGLIERLDTEPFIVGNVGSGTVQEMADWWEYVNFPGVSPMADKRRQNGRERPWGVRMWGVGNESWGCGGNMRPEYYADLYRRFATFLRPYGGVSPYRVATGAAGSDYNWTEVIMREAGDMIDGLDLHHYTLVGNWSKKGHATDFGEAEWFELMWKATEIKTLVERHSAIMDRYDPEKRVDLIVGEWGVWHEVEEGTNPGFLYQQNTIRDALVAAYHLNVFNNSAERVRGANIAQTVNVLQAMVLTRGPEVILTPTYHVFDFYTVHHDATMLPISLEAGRYTFGDQTIPAVSASASQDGDGTIHITLTNVDPNTERTIDARIRGAEVTSVTGRILTADEITAHNTFENPETVVPTGFNGATLDGDILTVILPAKSLVVLALR